MLLGHVGPTKINLDQIENRLTQPKNAVIGLSIKEIGFHSASEMFATYAGRARDLTPWLQNAQINCDRNLRLQYLAGLFFNANQGDAIYKSMAAFCKFPQDLFTGSDLYMKALKTAILTKLLK